MDWYLTVVMYAGIFDAFAVLLLGMVASAGFILKWDMENFWERVLPSVATLVLTNLSAASILGITRWWVGA